MIMWSRYTIDDDIIVITVHISERGETLRVKTICMTAKQGDYHHYDVHSLYGHYEAIATKL